MNIKLLSSSPLHSLNQFFPDGVPVDGELEVNGNPAYIFNTVGVETETLRKIVDIVNSNSMPFVISAILLSQHDLVIPKEWVCIDEQSTAES